MTQSDAAREFYLRHGYAPVADKVLAIDFDGTLYPRAGLFAAPAPMPGAVDAMRRLKGAGFRLVIFTSRLSPTYLAASGENADEQRVYIEGLLARDGIPYDEVTAEKVAAQWYVDDRAIHFDRDWEPIVTWLLFSREP